MIDLDQNETEHGDGFSASESASLADIELHPFSYGRQRAAWALGMRYPFKISKKDWRSEPNPAFDRVQEIRRLLKKKKGSEKLELERELAKLTEDGEPPRELDTYDGIADDAAICVFVRSLPDSEARLVRSRLTTYEEKFDEWADQNGLGIGGRNTGFAAEIFGRTIKELSVAQSEPILPKSTGEDASPNV